MAKHTKDHFLPSVWVFQCFIRTGAGRQKLYRGFSNKNQESQCCWRSLRCPGRTIDHICDFHPSIGDFLLSQQFCEKRSNSRWWVALVPLVVHLDGKKSVPFCWVSPARGKNWPRLGKTKLVIRQRPISPPSFFSLSCCFLKFTSSPFRMADLQQQAGGSGVAEIGKGVKRGVMPSVMAARSQEL